MREVDDLLAVGKCLREEPVRRDGVTIGMYLAEKLLQVRSRDGRTRALKANAVQKQFERTRGRSNIVLKARQMGVTTWVAGQFFLKTVTGRGVLTVQVAHTKEAAEGIFGIVQRMWENLPAHLREGALKRSKANAGQMVFPRLDSEFRVVSAGEENAGRGLTIQHLHCSEVGRWPGRPPPRSRDCAPRWRRGASAAWKVRRRVRTAPSMRNGCALRRRARRGISFRGGWSRRTWLRRPMR